jgi:hypothetical protein
MFCQGGAELLAWQAGIEPDRMAEIDFRHKLPGCPSDNYGIRITDVEGNEKVMVARECLGTNWGHGFFKYEACDYCDDIFSETADLAIGDAWLKQYTEDPMGNSVVIVRNAVIGGIIKDGIASGALQLGSLTEEEMRESQGGGFRHRRSGLGYRLYLKQKNGEWFPNKRVAVNKHAISFSRKLVLGFRIYLRDKSAEYWGQSRILGDYARFERKMHWPSQVYGMLLKSVGAAKDIVKMIKRY